MSGYKRYQNTEGPGVTSFATTAVLNFVPVITDAHLASLFGAILQEQL